MKKALCMLLTMMLLMSLGACALATQTDGEQADPFVIDMSKYGFRFVTPEKYRDLKGALEWDVSYLTDGIIQIDPTYYCFPASDFDAYDAWYEAWYNAMLAGEEAPEPSDPRWLTNREYEYVYTFFIISSDRSEEELFEEMMKRNGTRKDAFTWFEKLYSEGGFDFYGGQYAEYEKNREEYRKAMGEECFIEMDEIASDRETFLNALTFCAPTAPRTTMDVGEGIAFETTDLNGQPVSSQALFAESKVTMINLWATWCNPCKQELPQLEALSKVFEEQGCRIIGICGDADDEATMEKARAILEEKGVDYLNLAAPADVETLLPTITYPTSFFFDSEGRMIVQPIRGAKVEEYLPALNAALEQLPD